MRLIGNKTKLLAEIESFLGARGIASGTFIDIFTGTSSVARHFKSLGFVVLANDLLAPCYNQAVVGVEICEPPPFMGLLESQKKVIDSSSFREGYAAWKASRGKDSDLTDTGEAHRVSFEALRQAIHLLNAFVAPRDGIILRCFSPEGPHDRRYFRPQHARKIDGILEFLCDQRRRGTISRPEHHLLLNALLNAADRRANISGTYGAYLKKWQSNTENELSLEVPELVSGKSDGHRAFQRDANELVREIEGDILYLDPPYNHRQYAANYHVLQIIAEFHQIDDLESYESALYGKTGLRPYGDLRSAFCRPRNSRRRPETGPGDAFEAMKDLLMNARVEHVVVSYNEEGLLTLEEIGELLALFSGRPSFDYSRDFREVVHQRFRSDRDRSGEGEGGSRHYRVIEDKGRNRIGEWLFYARHRDCRLAESGKA